MRYSNITTDTNDPTRCQATCRSRDNERCPRTNTAVRSSGRRLCEQHHVQELLRPTAADQVDPRIAMRMKAVLGDE